MPAPRKHMKRRETAGAPRFVTFSCQSRLPLLRNEKICRLFVDAMARVRDERQLRVCAWVIMPEHVHLIVRSSPAQPLDRCLLQLKLSVAKTVIHRWKELNAAILHRIRTPEGKFRFWQAGGGFDRNIRDDDELVREIRYVHRNPVERRLVAGPDDWAWSSVHWWRGNRADQFECEYPPGDRRTWEGWTGYV